MPDEADRGVAVKPPTHTFVGVLPCGGALFKQLDQGHIPKLREIRATTDLGGRVERMTNTDALIVKMCVGCHKDKKTAHV